MDASIETGSLIACSACAKAKTKCDKRVSLPIYLDVVDGALGVIWQDVTDNHCDSFLLAPGACTNDSNASHGLLDATMNL